MLDSSVKHYPDADAEVVERPFQVASRSGRPRYSDDAKIRKVEPHWVVIDLKDADVNAWAHAYVESPANGSRKTSISKNLPGRYPTLSGRRKFAQRLRAHARKVSTSLR